MPAQNPLSRLPAATATGAPVPVRLHAPGKSGRALTGPATLLSSGRQSSRRAGTACLNRDPGAPPRLEALLPTLAEKNRRHWHCRHKTLFPDSPPQPLRVRPCRYGYTPPERAAEHSPAPQRYFPRGGKVAVERELPASSARLGWEPCCQRWLKKPAGTGIAGAKPSFPTPRRNRYGCARAGTGTLPRKERQSTRRPRSAIFLGAAK